MSAPQRVELTLRLDIDSELWALFNAALPGATGPTLAADVADWLVEVVSISRGATCGAVELVAVHDSTALSAKAEQLGIELPGGSL